MLGPNKGMKFCVIFVFLDHHPGGEKSLEERPQGEGGWNTLCFRQRASVSLEIEDDFFKKKKKGMSGTSLAVQCLILCASTAGGVCSIPSRGTKIPNALQHGQSWGAGECEVMDVI